MKKKENIKECANCAHFNDKKCTHPTNIGIEIKYRIETTLFLKTPEELNADNNCKNYHEKS